MTRIAADLSLRRRYLHDHVADRLRELILSGDLAPRQRISEIELAERIGISRTPMREAIKILATEGLLELLPNRGARVAHLSADEIEEVLAVIAGLEAMAAELACRVISDFEIAAVAATHESMLSAWRTGDEAAYFKLNRAIHDAMMAAARNRTLQDIYNNLSGRVARARYSAHKTPEQWRKAVDEHQRMLDLLQCRDGQRLAALLRTHILEKRPVIEAAYGESAVEPSDRSHSEIGQAKTRSPPT